MNFRIAVEPERFLNLVYTTNSLERRIKSIDLIVSPRDIYQLWRAGAEIHIEGMSKKELEAILRSLKDKKGREPYQKSNIHITRINPSNAYWFQLFVQRDKLISLSGLVEILEEFGYLGIVKVPPLYLVANIGKEAFLAFYIPPLIEVRSREEIREYGLRIIEKIEKGEHPMEYILPGVNGDIKVNVLEIVREVINRTEGSNATYVILDGTHRNYLTYLAGTTIQSIIIEKSEGDLETFPVLRKHLIITREKPKKEYRFVAPNYEAWVNLKEIGIDG